MRYFIIYILRNLEKYLAPFGCLAIHATTPYADYKAPLSNDKRGYATISISWAGRISAPDHNVNPNVVKLFWENKTDDPLYRLTTDWGALDAYHAPSREGKDAFTQIPVYPWSYDAVPSPRNSSWALCALGARRAITFLEQQPVVDKDRIGVYGHSMGGKLTVLTTGSDSRVKAAVPSCGGISDLRNEDPLFRATVGDEPYLKNIKVPILFLSPANDFHGLVGDLPASIQHLGTKNWRISSAPHHNHQDTPEYEVATQLWFDQHLKNKFSFPSTPLLHIGANQKGVPILEIKVDESKPILSVDVYYTQHGKSNKNPGDRDDMKNTTNMFWHHGKAKRINGKWVAQAPIQSQSHPLWIYANVTYGLKEKVSGAGYYYGAYTSNKAVLSSKIILLEPQHFAPMGMKASLKTTPQIEDFEGDWKQEWYAYRPQKWVISTHKVYSELYKAPKGSSLSFQVQSDVPNKLVVKIDDYAAVVDLKGGPEFQDVFLKAEAFKDAKDQPMKDFQGIKDLKLTELETLRSGHGAEQVVKQVGAPWQGKAPTFKDMQWKKFPVYRFDKKYQPKEVVYKEIDGNKMKMTYIYPPHYKGGGEGLSTMVMYFGGGWFTGDIGQFSKIGTYLADRGMIIVMPEYRTISDHGVQPIDCLKDAKSAMRFIHTHAQKYGVDVNKISAGGRSAGGHLAAAISFCKDINAASDDLDVNCIPKALVLINPVIDNGPGGFLHGVVEPYWEAFSPLHNVSANPPATLFMTGDKDQYTPIETAYKYETAMKKHGGRCDLAVYEGGVHGFIGFPQFNARAMQDMNDFLVSCGFIKAH